MSHPLLKKLRGIFAGGAAPSASLVKKEQGFSHDGDSCTLPVRPVLGSSRDDRSSSWNDGFSGPAALPISEQRTGPSMSEGSDAIVRLKELDRTLSTELDSVPSDLVLEHIFDSIPAIVVLLNRDGEVVRANQEAREFVKCRALSDHQVGRRCATPCSDCRLRVLADPLEDAKVLLGRKVHGIVRQFTDHDGVWMRMDKIPYCNPEGEVQGLLVFGIDVTELVAAQGGR